MCSRGECADQITRALENVLRAEPEVSPRRGAVRKSRELGSAAGRTVWGDCSSVPYKAYAVKK